MEPEQDDARAAILVLQLTVVENGVSRDVMALVGADVDPAALDDALARTIRRVSPLPTHIVDMDAVQKVVIAIRSQPAPVQTTDPPLQTELVDQDTVPSCAICCEDFCHGSRVSKLQCTHLFHTNCIAQWFTRRNSCPICRYILPIAPVIASTASPQDPQPPASTDGTLNSRRVYVYRNVVEPNLNNENVANITSSPSPIMATGNDDILHGHGIPVLPFPVADSGLHATPSSRLIPEDEPSEHSIENHTILRQNPFRQFESNSNATATATAHASSGSFESVSVVAASARGMDSDSFGRAQVFRSTGLADGLPPSGSYPAGVDASGRPMSHLPPRRSTSVLSNPLQTSMSAQLPQSQSYSQVDRQENQMSSTILSSNNGDSNVNGSSGNGVFSSHGGTTPFYSHTILRRGVAGSRDIVFDQSTALPSISDSHMFSTNTLHGRRRPREEDPSDSNPAPRRSRRINSEESPHVELPEIATTPQVSHYTVITRSGVTTTTTTTRSRYFVQPSSIYDPEIARNHADAEARAVRLMEQANMYTNGHTTQARRSAAPGGSHSRSANPPPTSRTLAVAASTATAVFARVLRNMRTSPSNTRRNEQTMPNQGVGDQLNSADYRARSRAPVRSTTSPNISGPIGGAQSSAIPSSSLPAVQGQRYYNLPEPGVRNRPPASSEAHRQATQHPSDSFRSEERPGIDLMQPSAAQTLPSYETLAALARIPPSRSALSTGPIAQSTTPSINSSRRVDSRNAALRSALEIGIQGSSSRLLRTAGILRHPDRAESTLAASSSEHSQTDRRTGTSTTGLISRMSLPEPYRASRHVEANNSQSVRGVFQSFDVFETENRRYVLLPSVPPINLDRAADLTEHSASSDEGGRADE